MAARVLLIDNYDSFTYNLSQLVCECGVTDLKIVKNDQIGSDDINFAEKILISPGPGHPDELPQILALIKEFSHKKSILGICLGHQMIASVFGARIINLEKVYHGIKENIRVKSRQEILFDGMPETFEAGLYHSWAVSANDYPDCLEITSVSESGVIMSLRHKEFDVKGIQFHPESVMTGFGGQMMANWLK